MAAEWYFKVGGAEFGPVSPSELVKNAADGRISPDTEVRKGNGDWYPARKVASLFDRASQLKQESSDVPSLKKPIPEDLEDRWDTVFTSSAPATTTGKFEVIDEAEDGGFKVEILAYPRLGGSKDHQSAATIYFANQAGIRLKQIRITLTDGEAVTESGSLHFMVGQIQMESKIGGASGLGKATMKKFVTKEAAIMPRYRGTGQIHLEPSFSHFLIHRLTGEEVIADQGMFYCGDGTLDISSAIQTNVSSELFGGEGLFQTRISGTGICVFESPVPVDEVMRIDLKDETLQVDGNFALMRTGRIEFSVEKSTRSLLGTPISGEGLLQTFRGTGSVWLAPTQDIYQRLLSEGISAMGVASRSSNTAT